MWLLVPRAKISRRPSLQEAAAGPSRITPPKSSQSCQLPSHHLWNMWLLVPAAKQSMRFGPHDTAAGEPTIIPPRLAKPFHCVPFHHFWCMALSVPRTNTSRRLLDQEAAPGPSSIIPPKSSQFDHVIIDPPSVIHQRVLKHPLFSHVKITSDISAIRLIKSLCMTV